MHAGCSPSGSTRKTRGRCTGCSTRWTRRSPAGAPRRYAELDRAFHELIVSCAGNRKLYRIHAQMSDELLLCPPAADRETSTPSSAQALAGHRALVTALASRDGEGAARILQAHLAASTRTAPDGRLLTRSAPYPETSA